MTLLPLLLSTMLTACTSGSESPEQAPEEAIPPPAAAEQAARAAPDVFVSGTIQAPADAPAAQAVYVSVKPAGRPGPPLAAKRLPAGPFPLEFELTSADRPMGNSPVPDELQLKVTLDIDGDPMMKSDDDLESVSTVSKGTSAMSVTLVPRE